MRINGKGENFTGNLNFVKVERLLILVFLVKHEIFNQTGLFIYELKGIWCISLEKLGRIAAANGYLF